MKSPSKIKPTPVGRDTTPSLNTFLEEKKKDMKVRFCMRKVEIDGYAWQTVKPNLTAEELWSLISASISEAWEINNLKEEK